MEIENAVDMSDVSDLNDKNLDLLCFRSPVRKSTKLSRFLEILEKVEEVTIDQVIAAYFRLHQKTLTRQSVSISMSKLIKNGTVHKTSHQNYALTKAEA
jgi:hypothetical protein